MAHIPRIYHAGSLTAGPLALDGDVAKRLVGVMRVGLGEEFLLFSGDGREWKARVTGVGRPGMTATVEGVARQASPLPVVLETWIGVIRPTRFETALEKCVEAGADIIRLIAGEYSQRGDEASANRLERWQRIVIEAAEQSGRLFLPVIEPPERLPRLLDSYRGALVVADGAGGSALDVAPLLPQTGRLALAVGPEGGFSPDEGAMLKRRGALPLTLGPYILRTETAAIAGTAALRALTMPAVNG